MVLLRGKEEVEDEGDEGLIPSHGEEAMHHTDRHDLLLQLLPCVLLVAMEEVKEDLTSS